MEFAINLWAVLGAAAAAFAVGAFWYSPMGFGKVWMREMGITPERMKAMKLTPVQAMVLGFIATLLTSYILAHFIAVWAEVAESMTLADGKKLGFFVWLGFMMPIALHAVLWEGRSWKLFALNTAHLLVTTVLMAGILTYFS